jgi:solute carrier family 12 (potassium/chloride transporter), member 4/6
MPSLLDANYVACSPSILDFVQQLKGSKGLNLVATVVEPEEESCSQSQTHYYNNMARSVQRARAVIDGMMEARRMQGFAEVITAPILEAESTMIQTLGLGKLRPNTLVVCWPKPRDTYEETSARASRFLRFLGCATAFEKAVVALKPGTEPFPDCETVLTRGTIDIWWVVHDGGLLVLLAHLLKAHKVWKQCRLRIFTAVDVSESPVMIQRALAEYLHDVRIEAEVHVVDISKSDVAGFRNDWTLRAQRYRGVQAAEEINHPKPCARSILLKRASVAVLADEHKTIAQVFDGQQVDPEPSPKVNKRRRERSLAAQHLKSSIYANSSEADLVVLNLPVPSQYNFEDPASYLEMIDDMTLGLRRILLVHGSGTEAVSKFA